MPGKSKYTLGSKGRSDLHDVTLPSGKTCQARRPGVQGLIDAGILDSFDDLTALVQTQHIAPNTAAGMALVTPAQTQDASLAFMRDPTKLNTAFQVIDRLAAYCITQPVVWVDYRMTRCVKDPGTGELIDEPDGQWAQRAEQAERDGAYPVSQIDLEDKIWILNWAVGGSGDVSAFRQGTQQLLGNVASS